MFAQNKFQIAAPLSEHEIGELDSFLMSDATSDETMMMDCLDGYGMRLNASKYNRHWQDKTLNELGDFQRGKSRHRPRNDMALFLGGKHPLIQTGEIKEANLFITKHSATYNDFGLAQSKLWSKNTLCITIAANIAETALLGYNKNINILIGSLLPLAIMQAKASNSQSLERAPIISKPKRLTALRK